VRLTRLPISIERMPEGLRPGRLFPVGTIEWFLHWGTPAPPPSGRRISMLVRESLDAARHVQAR
jgi:hypothetical protein